MIFKQSPGEDPDLVTIAVGIAVVVAGILTFGALDTGNGSAELALLIVPLAFLLLGLWVIYDAFQTEDGKVRVKLKSTEGETEVSFSLENEDIAFAESVSRAVSNAHG